VDGSKCEHCLQQWRSTLHFGQVPVKSVPGGRVVEQLKQRAAATCCTKRGKRGPVTSMGWRGPWGLGASPRGPRASRSLSMYPFCLYLRSLSMGRLLRRLLDVERCRENSFMRKIENSKRGCAPGIDRGRAPGIDQSPRQLTLHRAKVLRVGLPEEIPRGSRGTLIPLIWDPLKCQTHIYHGLKQFARHLLNYPMNYPALTIGWNFKLSAGTPFQ